MHSWFLMSVTMLGLSSVVPLFVWGATGGNWRAALKAWREYGAIMLALAAPGIIGAAWLVMFPPR
jgi:hypothetical protein